LHKGIIFSERDDEGNKGFSEDEPEIVIYAFGLSGRLTKLRILIKITESIFEREPSLISGLVGV